MKNVARRRGWKQGRCVARGVVIVLEIRDACGGWDGVGLTLGVFTV